MKKVARTQNRPVDHRELLARQGLRLPAVTLDHLRSAGIYCQPSISIEHQHLAKRNVLRGVESGGAVAELGAYSSFVDEQGGALSWLQRVDSIGVNGVHAIVVALCWCAYRCCGLNARMTCSSLGTASQVQEASEDHGSRAQFSSMDVEEAWRWSSGEKMQPSEAQSTPFSIAGAGSQSLCPGNFKRLRRD